MSKNSCLLPLRHTGISYVISVLVHFKVAIYGRAENGAGAKIRKKKELEPKQNNLGVATLT